MNRKTFLFAMASVLALLCFSFALDAVSASAASPSPVPSQISGLQVIAAQPVVSGANLLTAATQAFVSFGGFPWSLRVALLVLLVLASMKVTFLDGLIWDKLGKFQVWAAPVLGAVVGLIVMGYSGTLTLAGALAYFASGGGAVLLHEILDSVKGIPGLGAAYVSLIATLENALGGNPISASSPAPVSVPAGTTAAPTATS